MEDTGLFVLYISHRLHFVDYISMVQMNLFLGKLVAVYRSLMRFRSVSLAALLLWKVVFLPSGNKVSVCMLTVDQRPGSPVQIEFQNNHSELYKVSLIYQVNTV